MSLYGRTDSNTNKTKAGIGVASSSITPTIVFVDETEAALNENRTRGIDGPGWWSYYTYTTEAGDTRHKAEKLVALADPDTNANETQSDDTIAADVASAVTITGQPANSTSSSGAGTFAVTTSTTGTPGTLSYKWQRQTANGTTWKDITASLDSGITYADFTTATLAYSGLASAARNGTKFRVKITSAGGTEEIISNGSATLTFGT